MARAVSDQLNGFIFDVELWSGSVAQQRMSFAEKGVYLAMLFQEWRGGPLPDDAHAVAELIAVAPSQVAEVEAAWPVVRRKFVTTDRDPRCIINVRLEKTRRAQKKYLATKKIAGKRGGEAAAANRRHKSSSPSSTATALLQQRSTSAIAQPTDLISRDQIGEEKKRSKERTPSAERSATTQPVRQAFEQYHHRFVARYHGKPEYAGAKDGARMSKLLKAHGLEEVTRRIAAFFESADPWIQRSGHTLDVFFAAGTQTKLVAERGAARPRVNGCRHTPECEDASAHTQRLIQERDAPGRQAS